MTGEPKKKLTKEVYAWSRSEAMIRAGGAGNPALVDRLQQEVLEAEGYEIPERRGNWNPDSGVSVEEVARGVKKVPFEVWNPVPEVWGQEFRQCFPMAKKGSPTDLLLYFISHCRRRGFDEYCRLSYRQIRRETGFSNGYIAKLLWMFEDSGILGSRDAKGVNTGGNKRPDKEYRVLPEQYWKIGHAKTVRERWSIRERNLARAKKVQAA